MKRINNITTCDICFKLLDKHNINPKKDSHFIDTCLEHSVYAKTFLHEVISEILGFKDVSIKNCEVCKNQISDAEIKNCLNVNSFHFLCAKHINKSTTFIINK